jgi:hypothetical protein
MRKGREEAVIGKGLTAGSSPPYHQEKVRSLPSARFFSMVSPAKYGRLGPFYFWEVGTWLSKARFWALPATSRHFRCFWHFESDRSLC